MRNSGVSRWGPKMMKFNTKPKTLREAEEFQPDAIMLEVIFSILMLLYVILILHCGRKLYSLRKKLKKF